MSCKEEECHFLKYMKEKNSFENILKEYRKEFERTHYKVCYTCDACRRRYCLQDNCPDKKKYGWRKRGKVYG